MTVIARERKETSKSWTSRCSRSTREQNNGSWFARKDASWNTQRYADSKVGTEANRGGKSHGIRAVVRQEAKAKRRKAGNGDSRTLLSTERSRAVLFRQVFLDVVAVVGVRSEVFRIFVTVVPPHGSTSWARRGG